MAETGFTTVEIEIPDDLLAFLKPLAAERQMTIEEFIVDILREYVERVKATSRGEYHRLLDRLRMSNRTTKKTA